MTSKPITTGVIAAVAILAGAAAIKAAERSGVLSAEGGMRAFQAVMGLMVAFYGNLIPKGLSRIRSIEAERRKQSALRVSGWAFTLAGLAYAALYALAPLAIADKASDGAIIGAIAITLIYSLWCFAAGPRANGGGAT